MCGILKKDMFFLNTVLGKLDECKQETAWETAGVNSSPCRGWQGWCDGTQSAEPFVEFGSQWWCASWYHGPSS